MAEPTSNKLEPTVTNTNNELPYLGYILTNKGLKPNPERVEAIINIERPSSIRALRRFLGMCNYYRRFIANYSAVVRALTDLVKDKLAPNENINNHYSFSHP